MMQTSHEITIVDDEAVNASKADNSVKESTNEVKSSSKSTRRSDLSLKIPTRHAHLESSKGGTSSKVVKGVRFKEKTPRDGESSPLLHPESPIVTKIKSIFNGNRSRSFPVKHGSNMSPSITTPVSAKTYSEQQKSQIREAKPPVSRSLSMPLRNIVIVRSVSFAARKDNDQIESADDEIIPTQVETEEEIDEEEAVCRICMDTCAEGNQFKMECSCKGALRLVHEECAVKWFTTFRGDKTCEVCGREVSNLPVTLFRMRSYVQRQNITTRNQQGLDPRTISAWQEIVRLVLISTICYFFVIEQLLINELKTQAVVIAAPFALTFGILSSTFAAVLAMEYIWRYAVLEFALVAMLLHLFYSLLQLKAIYAVMVSSVIGFGLAMTLNELYIRYTGLRVQYPQEYNILS